MLTDILHHRLLIIRIINGKTVIVSQTICEAAQNPHTGRMKGGHPDAFCTHSYEPFHSFLHLTGRLIGKRNRHDLIGIHSQLINQIGNAVCQHPRFPRACSCK